MAKDAAKKMKDKNYAVLGLGRFGRSVVQALSEYDVNILACDKSEAALQWAADYATHSVQADVEDEAALARLELGNFDVVVLAMGEDFEATQIAVMIAKESGAKHVIAKANTSRQKKLLESVGADEVILPEREMGIKLARRMVNPDIVDILEESEYYTITEMHPMEEWIGKTVRQADIRRKYGLTVVATRRGERITIPVSPDEPIAGDDLFIVLSEKQGGG